MASEAEKHLQALRAKLVNDRRRWAEMASKGTVISGGPNPTAAFLEAQERIEVVDRAILDEKALSNRTASVPDVEIDPMPVA